MLRFTEVSIWFGLGDFAHAIEIKADVNLRGLVGIFEAPRRTQQDPRAVPDPPRS